MCQFPLFETISIVDGQVQNIQYHQQRLNNAMRHYFNQNKTFNLNKIIDIPYAFQQGKIRCRVDYNAKSYQVNFFHYQPKKISTFQCVYTENLDYTFKYSDRKRLDFPKVLQADEIIIINNGKVSDCSIGNLLFLKQNQWYSSRHFLLKGTQLSYLLDQSKVELADIAIQNIFDYEQIMMINALNPFDLARAIPISSATILR